MNPVVTISQAGRPIATRVVMAHSLTARTLGFMGRRRPPPGDGLLLTRCRAIHTCFMRFPLDVIFLDRSNRIVRIIKGLKPWRFALGGRQAVSVLELPSGSLMSGVLDNRTPLRLSDAEQS